LRRSPLAWGWSLEEVRRKHARALLAVGIRASLGQHLQLLNQSSPPLYWTGLALSTSKPKTPASSSRRPTTSSMTTATRGRTGCGTGTRPNVARHRRPPGPCSRTSSPPTGRHWCQPRRWGGDFVLARRLVHHGGPRRRPPCAVLPLHGPPHHGGRCVSLRRSGAPSAKPP
jgi:hypothetical protein